METRAGKMIGLKASSAKTNLVMDSSPCMVSDQSMATSANHLLTKLVKQNSAPSRLMGSSVTIKACHVQLSSQEKSHQDHSWKLKKNSMS